jgi:hypothetical protein
MKKISTIVFFTLLFMQGRLWPQDLVSRLCAGAYAVDDATMITFSAKSFDIHARNTAGKETVTSYPVIYSVTGQISISGSSPAARSRQACSPAANT